MTQLRGLFTFNRQLHALRGATLFRVAANGVATPIGNIGSTAGPVDFAANLTQLGIVDGTALWVYNGTTLVESPDYIPGTRIAVVAQRLVGIQSNTQKFGYSAIGNMMAFDPLDFYSAEAVPDNLVSMVEVYGNLLMLGTEGGEIWEATSGADDFQRNTGAYVEFGGAAAHALRKIAGSCMWLSSSKEGQASVMQLQGYTAKAVSTRAIEERFEGLDLGGATAWTRVEGKRESYCLNVPGVDTTLVYDTTFQQWHEEAELVNGAYRQFRARCHAFAYGRHYVGDNDGRLYRLDEGVHNFAGDVKVRDRISPVIAEPSFSLLSFSKFEVLCERATAGTVMLRYSENNGASYKNWHTRSTGAAGKHRTRIKFDRLGQARDRVYHLRFTDDAPFNPVTVNAEVTVPPK